VQRRFVVVGLAVLLLATVATGAALALSNHGASTSSHAYRGAGHGVSVIGAQVTAATAHGNSVVRLSFVNATDHPVVLTAVGSPDARSSRLHIDSNMCQGGTLMIPIPEIDVAPHAEQPLGFKNEGAMLGGLLRPLSKGTNIPLVVRWTDEGGTMHALTTTAQVIAPPPHLNTAMIGMRM